MIVDTERLRRIARGHVGPGVDIRRDILEAADEIDRLRAEVERLQWRDAAEAPRDGTHFLAWSGGQTFNTHPPTVAHWFVDGFYTSVNEIEPERKFRVLWWMPLPDTPKETPCKP